MAADAAIERIRSINDRFVDMEPLWTIKLNELDTPAVDIPEDLVNYKQIASYNWFGTPSKPIIVVPGAPKKFENWKGGRLDMDSGDLMADENHYMLPNYPMEPLFQAVKLCNEENFDTPFKFQEIDISTDRNNLRKLFSIFNTASGDRPATNELQIYVQRIGRLVCLIRCQLQDKEAAGERSAWSIGQRGQMYPIETFVAFARRHPTYGKSFEQNCSKPINDLTKGSFRQIVRYNFGNLKFMVRFEVDCAEYEKSSLVAAKSPSSDATGDDDDDDDDGDVDLNKRMTKLSISGEKLPGSDLRVIRHGEKRNYHLVEVTTRFYTSYRPKQFPARVWPQMFLSGTKTLVLGWQHKGYVKPNDGIETYDVKSVQKKYGPFPKADLRRLHNLLAKVVDFVRDQEQDRIFAIIWNPETPDAIKIFDVEDVDRLAVPDGLKRFVEQN